MEHLTKRAEFIEASKGEKFVTPSFVILKHSRSFSDNVTPKIGYTATKKIGTAVIRNRAKRRLRSAAMKIIYKNAQDHTNYVLIARKKLLKYPYKYLINDLTDCMS
ncbi:MAG: ribonuclease P protein component [Hyphomicrobiales bacterium]|jgi:ribonuclease P protein component|nr:ribonuclease P protein component [Hyphomicrobiales bacterium]|tara:strand:+ start:1549 stop:1866 length:318 start_codon:yes stop_codon:yes gene_type:complete